MVQRRLSRRIGMYITALVPVTLFIVIRLSMRAISRLLAAKPTWVKMAGTALGVGVVATCIATISRALLANNLTGSELLIAILIYGYAALAIGWTTYSGAVASIPRKRRRQRTSLRR